MSKEITSEIEKCETILKFFFKKSRDIHVNTERSISNIDNQVKNYLLEQGYAEWLVKDISSGYQVGGISEKALCNLVESGETFNNKHVGKYTLEVDHGPMSVRSFMALPIKK